MDNCRYKVSIGFVKLFLLLVVPSSLNAQNFGASHACNTNQNLYCPWVPSQIQNNIRSVFVYSNNIAGCTGTLINQRVDQDHLQQYFITAKHCINGANFSNNWNFYFNYQSLSCDPNATPVPNRIIILASPVTLVDAQDWTDIALLKIQTPIPPHFNVYYSGWDTNLGVSPVDLMIYHPHTDIKKAAQGFLRSCIDGYGMLCHNRSCGCRRQFFIVRYH